MNHELTRSYQEDCTDLIAFPLGGIGSGMVCLNGKGGLSKFSLWHAPNLNFDPCVFSAVCVTQDNRKTARVLEGNVPARRIFGTANTGLGIGDQSFGLPRFRNSSFSVSFPFARVMLQDAAMPVDVDILAWSPFIPGDEDASSLPAAAIEYSFTNRSDTPVELVYSFNAKNFMKKENGCDFVQPIKNGFVLSEKGHDAKPWQKGDFAVTVLDGQPCVNHAWFRGSWWDSLTMAWQDIEQGRCFNRPPVTQSESSPGASLFIPMALQTQEKRKVTLLLTWYVPLSNLRTGPAPDPDSSEKGDKKHYKPWYAGKFASIADVTHHFSKNYNLYYQRSRRFSECLSGKNLPDAIVEAVSANLTTFKSTTFLRQDDGRFWGWEGSADEVGSCPGNCTHVYNYAQAIAHLFPGLDRSILQTEYNEDLSDEGRQAFRAELPVRPSIFDDEPACDGQLGSVMRVHRHWRISGDQNWLCSIWPKVKLSIDFCINHWDPDQSGVLTEPHHNTYDVEFWGPDGMSVSIYLGALQAVIAMGKAVQADTAAYETLLAKGKKHLDESLYRNGYYCQNVAWKNARSADPLHFRSWWGYSYTSEESRSLFAAEGPKYQYGDGCLSDGIIGEWMAEFCAVGSVLDSDKVNSALQSIYQYNYKKSLASHANTQRAGYAAADEGGLLLCTWPFGNKRSLPFPYSNEVWTGIEYQVASHLITRGKVQEGLEIVNTCRRRYDGTVRNPFDEYECGHWYARALSSYALFQALTGVRFDAVDRTLTIKPRLPGDFSVLLATDGWFGTAGVAAGKPFYKVVEGTADVSAVLYLPYREGEPE
jgi:uncharacterized protein (DUF608 family)